jgi:hypothetical protein
MSQDNPIASRDPSRDNGVGAGGSGFSVSLSCPQARSEARDTRTCYHAASHAVVARYVLEQRLRWATVNPGRRDDGDGFNGRVVWPMPPIGEVASEFIDDDPTELDAAPPSVADGVRGYSFLRIMMAAAGFVGERLFLGRDAELRGNDRRNAFEHAALICRSANGVRHVVAAAEAEAEAILLARGHAVHALAAALQIRRTMTGEEIDNVIERALASPATQVRARMQERQRMLDTQRDYMD